ncbi:MAG: hypothetical protein JRF02_07125 [Deltaproteobacteria bacterium]|jgi:hypothetical protein|nr:hypothetical protein [Deltaproteobacteria bacterium]
MHNINILGRIVFYSLWVWIFYFDGLHLSEVMRSFLNCLVLADIVTWLGYQFYLLPRMMVQFGIGTVVNAAVMILLIRDAKSLVPQTVDMQAMAIMIFFSVAALKGFYYVLIEMGYLGSLD